MILSHLYHRIGFHLSTNTSWTLDCWPFLFTDCHVGGKAEEQVVRISIHGIADWNSADITWLSKDSTGCDCQLLEECPQVPLCRGMYAAKVRGSSGLGKHPKHFNSHTHAHQTANEEGNCWVMLRTVCVTLLCSHLNYSPLLCSIKRDQNIF